MHNRPLIVLLACAVSLISACSQPTGSDPVDTPIDIGFDGDLGPLSLVVYERSPSPSGVIAFAEGVPVEVVERANGQTHALESGPDGRVALEAVDWSEGLDVHWLNNEQLRTLSGLDREGMTQLVASGRVIDGAVALPISGEFVTLTFEAINVPAGMSWVNVYTPWGAVENSGFGETEFTVTVRRADETSVVLFASSGPEATPDEVQVSQQAAVRLTVGSRIDNRVVVDFAEAQPLVEISGSFRLPDSELLNDQTPRVSFEDEDRVTIGEYSEVRVDRASGVVEYTVRVLSGEETVAARVTYNGAGYRLWDRVLATDSELERDPSLPAPPIQTSAFEAIVRPGDRVAVVGADAILQQAWVNGYGNWLPWVIYSLSSRNIEVPTLPAMGIAPSPNYELSVVACAEVGPLSAGWGCYAGARGDSRELQPD